MTMSQFDTTGRDSEKFMLQLPAGMHEEIANAAEANRRSMNAEIVSRLEDSSAPTLRDYFAGKAMAGVHAEYLLMVDGRDLTSDDYHNLAADCYKQADAMLRARSAPMSNTNTDAVREALPPPAFHLFWRADQAAYKVDVPSIGDTDVYTADQMREYALAATASTQAEVQRLREALTRSAELLSGMADGMREVVSEQGDGSSAPSKQEGQS
jgi:hypothetical protein